jgi:HEAT repeat protein
MAEIEDNAMMQSLASESVSTRIKALVEIGKLGELGAMTMGTNDAAYRMIVDPDVKVQAAAVLALGNMGKSGEMYLENIGTLVETSHKEVKLAAVKALGMLGEPAATYASAVEGCLGDRDDEIIAAACVALGSMKATSSASKVAAFLKGADTDLAIAACTGLGLMGAESAEVAKAMDAKDLRLRAAACTALIPKGADYLKKAVALLGDSDVYVRTSAMYMIESAGEKAADVVDDIGKLLTSEDTGVKIAAAAALGGIGEKAASQASALEALLSDGSEDMSSLMLSIAGTQKKFAPSLRKPACAAADALAAIGAEASAPAVAKALGSCTDYETKASCATALGKMGKEGAKFEDTLIPLLEDVNPMVVAASCTSLGLIAECTSANPAAAEKVVECLKNAHPGVRGSAAKALGKMGDEAIAYIEDLFKCFSDQTPYVRAMAVEAVATVGETGQMYASEVCRLMFDPQVKVRLAAVDSLKMMGERGASFAEEVVSLLSDGMPEVRGSAIKALESFGNENIYPFVQAIQEVAEADPAPEVQEAAAALASTITVPSVRGALENNE